jgi:lipid A 3-O-deacylase PagL
MHLKRATRGLLAAAVLGFASMSASAQRIEVQGGRSYMDSHPTNVYFIESVFSEAPIGQSRWTWAPDVSLGYIGGREGQGVRRYADSHPGTRDDVWLLGAGARLRYGQVGDWYHPFFFSFQAAGQSGRTQALSSGYEFISTLGWQWKFLSLQIRHVSNGGFTEPNRGETMALVGFGFDF